MRQKKSFAARLRHYIEFIQIQDDEVEGVIVHGAFAEITSLSELGLKEFDDINFGHLLNEEYFVFTTRFINNLSSKIHIRFNNRIFMIRKIISPYQLNHIMKIIAQEIEG
ncbi:MAG: hypothetical protein SFT93_05795 [Rickettsiaceae bacterium]|nr:hypothetical protein [Rickettsiaceae bacterium]